MQPTPQAAVTVAEGIATDASSEFWQRVTQNAFIVYENVPNSLGRNILQSRDPDTSISAQLSRYPKRIVSLASGGGGAFQAGGVHFDGSTYLNIASLAATNSSFL